MGFHHIEIAIPFCRMVKGAEEVCTILSEHRLKRGHNNLRDHFIDIGVDAFAFEPPNFVRGSLQIAKD